MRTSSVDRLQSSRAGAGSISLRYGIDGEEPKTVREVVRLFGLKDAHVREIESEALKRLAVRRAIEALPEAA